LVWYIAAALYIWKLFVLWLHTIFVLPFQHLEMLWILIPAVLAWFFAEFFQEKTGTSMGNAITNSIVIIWGSIDCARQTVRLISEKVLTDFWNVFSRFALLGVILAYGISIIILGWRGNKIVKYIGRIREVTYAFVLFVPVFYNVIPFSWDHIIATIIFFPVGYFVIELVDRYTPNPRAIMEDMREGSQTALPPSRGMAGKDEDFDNFGGFEQEEQFNQNYQNYPRLR